MPRFAWPALASLLVLGCPAALEPLVFSPNPVEMPDARPFFASSATASVVNQSGETWQITGVSVDSADEGQASVFSVRFADGAEGATLEPSESVDVLLDFQPLLIGDYEASLVAVARLRSYDIGGGGCSAGCGREAPDDGEYFVIGAVIGTADPEAPFEDCTDGEDNDEDGLVDCDDPDCATNPACDGDDEDCDNGIDDDGDGDVDCDDEDCALDPACAPLTGCEPEGELTCGPPTQQSTANEANNWEDYCGAGFDGFTGGEDVWAFQPDDFGAVTVRAGAQGWDLDLTVLQAVPQSDGSLGCDPEVCVATSWNPPGPGFEEATFDADPSVLYLIVVDGWDGAEGAYGIGIECNTGLEDCGNGVDDDGDGRIDCEDFDCRFDPLCSGGDGFCAPTGGLQCPSAVVSGDNAGPQSTNDITDWCGAGFDGWTGPEIAFLFTPSSSGPVQVTASGLTDDLDLAVLLLDPMAPPDEACNPRFCVDTSQGGGSDPESITFDAFAGTSYVIALDGWDGAVSPFTLTLDCAPETEVCDDGQDNDNDTLVDCDDPDCEFFPDCVPPGQEICSDGADNDGDGAVDCADPDCALAPNCAGLEVCDNGVDDDGDMLIDCQDLDCITFPGCDAGDGDCCAAHGGPGCDDENGEDCVCSIDPFCCNVAWDALCADEYVNACGGSCNGSEDCINGIDDDGDNLVDCADADCAQHPACQGGGELVCNDNLDNDNDGDVDCADLDCAVSPFCQGGPENCTDGVDNDGDGDIDCADSDCTFLPICDAGDGDCCQAHGNPGCDDEPGEDCVCGTDSFCCNVQWDALCAQEYQQGCGGVCTGVEVCDNGLDDDGDGAVDCNDTDCIGDPNCAPPANETSCVNGVDDDLDGDVDCDDSDCVLHPSCNTPPVEISCVNGVDDDLDGDVDCDDIDCASHPACVFPPESNCVNGIDDDADGYTDCNDSNCATNPACAHNEFDCADGADNDGDGQIDCADGDCSADIACVSTGVCNPLGNLQCGSIVSGSNTMPGSTNQQDVYCGYNPGGWFGSEVSWLFTPTQDGLVEVTLTGLTEDLDIQALVQDAGGCYPNECEANGWNPPPQPESMDWYAFAGTPYYILIDGWQGASSNFTMTVTCSPSSETQCGNGIDDDSDGQTDCADVDCLGSPSCPETACTNGIDDDADGFIDCNDPDCFGTIVCIPEFLCDNGQDDDGDGDVDCDDSDCAFAVECTPEDCDNGTDDDGDGDIDCADPDCVSDPACVTPVENCGNGVDDDSDGLVDCADPFCAGSPLCPTTEVCDDGLDNDADGRIDCLDSECAGAANCASESICDDGLDNDGDQQADCFDTDCFGAPGCPLVLFSSIDDDPADFTFVPLAQHGSQTGWEQGVPDSASQSGSGPNAPFAGTDAWCTGCDQAVTTGGRFQGYLLAQPAVFDLSALSGGTLTLSFRQWLVMPGLPFVDIARVDASSDGGATTQVVWGPTVSSTTGWQYVEVDLSTYLGGDLTFAFRYDSLSGFGGGNADGWYLDDVVLTWYP